MIKMHRTQQNTNLGTIAAAALIGGLAGAVVALMFAPKSGKALRQGIHDKTSDVIDHAEEATFHHAGALKQQGVDLVDKGKKLAEDLQTFIQESLKIKKPGYIPINTINDTPKTETLQPETEATPLTVAQPEVPLQAE
jgi:gas vesicle protein